VFDSIEDPIYLDFFLWNLTNPESVLNASSGIKPNYTSVGPYVYRSYRQKVNIAFSEDNKRVSYDTQQIFQWCADCSGDRAEDDVIYNVNSGYLGVLQLLGSETNLQYEVSSIELKQIIDFMATTFVSDYSLNIYSSVLNKYLPELIATINQTLGDSEASMRYFLAVWANTTSEPVIDADWEGMTLCSFPEPSLTLSDHHQCSGISMQSALLLWDSSVNNSLVSCSEYVGQELIWPRAMHNETTQAALMYQFNLTLSQLTAILTWLSSDLITIRTEPYLKDQYHTDNITDLGYIQWATASTLESNSIKNIYPMIFKRGIPEISLVPPYYCSMETDVAKTFLVGNYGVTKPKNVELFLGEFNKTRPDFSKWGFVDNGNYLALCAKNYLINLITANYTIPHLNSTLSQGGLIAERTVSDWLFNCVDPTMGIIVHDSSCSIFANNSVVGTDTVYTGYRNIKKIMKYYEFQNKSQIRGVWEGPINVTGASNNLQFKPFLDDGDTVLKEWSELALRPINLTRRKNQKKKVYGVEVWGYRWEEDAFEQSSFFKETVPGFANMTAAWEAPLYIGHWDMYGVPPANSTDLIIGLSPNPNLTTFYEIQPVVGHVWKMAKRWQVSVLIPKWANDIWFTKYYQNSLVDVFFPLVKVAEKTEISEQQAQDYKDETQKYVWLGNFLFWLSIAVGVFLIVFSVAVAPVGIFMYWRKSKKPVHPYHEITDSDINYNDLLSGSDTTINSNNMYN